MAWSAEGFTNLCCFDETQMEFEGHPRLRDLWVLEILDRGLQLSQ